jgi:(p)ppGpp synthase/HD superfamily hydrolase
MMILSNRFSDALTFATQLHSQQVRKGSGVPYIAHLLAVTSIVLEQGGSEEEAIAALLHDAIEDQGGAATRAEIHRRYGETVTAIVEGCTDSYTTPKPPWLERKLAYIAHIPEASTSVRLVSSADKLHNARSILHDYRLAGDTVWQRFQGGKEGTLWYYRSLVKAFRATESTPIIDELEFTVKKLESLISNNQNQSSSNYP